MIRYAKHNSSNVNYVVVNSTLEIDGVVVPFEVQVNIKNLAEKDHSKVFRVVSMAFNRHLNFTKPKPQPKKAWWQQIFKS